MHVLECRHHIIGRLHLPPIPMPRRRSRLRAVRLGRDQGAEERAIQRRGMKRVCRDLFENIRYVSDELDCRFLFEEVGCEFWSHKLRITDKFQVESEPDMNSL